MAVLAALVEQLGEAGRLAAVVEHGIGGSTAAAPVVGAVIEAAMAEWNGTGEEQGEGSPASPRPDTARSRHGDVEGEAGSASAPETQPVDDPG